jgi:hypothetical protein
MKLLRIDKRSQIRLGGESSQRRHVVTAYGTMNVMVGICGR